MIFWLYIAFIIGVFVGFLFLSIFLNGKCEDKYLQINQLKNKINQLETENLIIEEENIKLTNQLKSYPTYDVKA